MPDVDPRIDPARSNRLTRHYIDVYYATLDRIMAGWGARGHPPGAEPAPPEEELQQLQQSEEQNLTIQRGADIWEVIDATRKLDRQRELEDAQNNGAAQTV
mgnify:CR=1 FL=1